MIFVLEYKNKQILLKENNSEYVSKFSQAITLSTFGSKTNNPSGGYMADIRRIQVVDVQQELPSYIQLFESVTSL